MSFVCYGRGQPDGIVWAQEVKRYQFTSFEEIKVPSPHGEAIILSKGSNFKINKSEAYRFFKKGYVLLKTHYWDNVGKKTSATEIHLCNGEVTLEIKKVVLTEHNITIEDVTPKSKKK